MKLLAKERDLLAKEVAILMENYHLKKLQSLKKSKQYKSFCKENKEIEKLFAKAKRIENQADRRQDKLRQRIEEFNEKKGFHHNTGISQDGRTTNGNLDVEWDSFGIYADLVKKDIVYNSFKEIDVKNFVKELFNKYKDMSYEDVQKLDDREYSRYRYYGKA
jgi:hypothetical protein